MKYAATLCILVTAATIASAQRDAMRIEPDRAN